MTQLLSSITRRPAQGLCGEVAPYSEEKWLSYYEEMALRFPYLSTACRGDRRLEDSTQRLGKKTSSSSATTSCYQHSAPEEGHHRGITLVTHPSSRSTSDWYPDRVPRGYRDG